MKRDQNRKTINYIEIEWIEVHETLLLCLQVNQQNQIKVKKRNQVTLLLLFNNKSKFFFV